MRKISIAFIIFLLMSGFSGEVEKTILFLGDSITAGDGLEQEYAFPALIEQRLEGIKTINQGHSGWATSSYIRRWGEVKEALPQKVDMIFIQLGANDLRIDGHSDKTVKLCHANMEEILRRLETIYPKTKIVLMSSPKFDYKNMSERIKEAYFGKHSNFYIKKIGNRYKKMATDKAYGFIDLHHRIPKHSTLDGAHLSIKGHETAAEIIAEYILNN